MNHGSTPGQKQPKQYLEAGDAPVMRVDAPNRSLADLRHSISISVLFRRTLAPWVGALSLLLLSGLVDRAQGERLAGKSLPAPERSRAASPAAEDGATTIHGDIAAWDPELALVATMPEQSIQLGTKQSAYLHLTVAMEVSRQTAADELAAGKAEFQDAAAKIVHSMPPLNLQTLEGKIEIKRKLLRAANRMVKSGVARDIYFTQFTIEEVH
jgi:flagellar basal body-associated protein FliL